jgi:hypothetical protein
MGNGRGVYGPAYVSGMMEEHFCVLMFCSL